MISRLRNAAALFAMILVLLPACTGADEPQASLPPTAPLDLKTGQTDNTPLQSGGLEANLPLSPPQTVEGTLVSLDESRTYLTVRTLRDGDVKVGLPENIVISCDGREGTLNNVKPGDRIFATVVTAQGNRALRLVSETPPNPLRNTVGLPILGLLALGIWRFRVKTAPAAKSTR